MPLFIGPNRQTKDSSVDRNIVRRKQAESTDSSADNRHNDGCINIGGSRIAILTQYLHGASTTLHCTSIPEIFGEWSHKIISGRRRSAMPTLSDGIIALTGCFDLGQ